jgi:hypothetical protein
MRAGDIVEVKTKEEILKTLDENGMLDSMPFMPEMFQFCGKQFEVYKRADKTCDTIYKTGARRLHDSVHLKEIRCDGSAHGGCEASCLMFWKEAWLKKVNAKREIPVIVESQPAKQELSEKQGNVICSEKTVTEKAIRKKVKKNGDTETYYMCQITELVRATEKLKWWDIRQYYRDLAFGNVSIGRFIRASIIALFRNLSNLGMGYRVVIATYNKLKWLHGGVEWPYRVGSAPKTPKETLDLRPGDIVEVKSHEEILATLDKRNKNRGLYFDAEMVPYCGKRFKVLKRVSRILDEESGKMLEFNSDCIILQDVVCQSDYSGLRMFCPRSVFAYWREIWLKRVEEVG